MASVYSVTSGGAPLRPNHITSAAGTSAARTAHKNGRYDQLALSSGADGEQRFRLDLVGRLSQEVRATTTTGELQELKRQIHSGEYRPDASEIAARLLLQKEDV